MTLLPKVHHSEWQKKNKEKVNKIVYDWRKRNPSKVILTRARGKAKERGWEFNLELSDIVIPEVCPYFGEPLRFEGKLFDWAPSLDRIDNSKGYIKGNVEVISYLANRMKNNASQDTLLRFCQAVINRSKT